LNFLQILNGSMTLNANAFGKKGKGKPKEVQNFFNSFCEERKEKFGEEKVFALMDLMKSLETQADALTWKKTTVEAGLKLISQETQNRLGVVSLDQSLDESMSLWQEQINMGLKDNTMVKLYRENRVKGETLVAALTRVCRLVELIKKLERGNWGDIRDFVLSATFLNDWQNNNETIWVALKGKKEELTSIAKIIAEIGRQLQERKSKEVVE
jgi:hypothetical protein